MPYFYFKLKEKNIDPGRMSNWKFPPLWCDVVEARDKKEARAIIESNYGRKLPQRVPANKLKNHDLLLNLKEVKPGDFIYNHLLEPSNCKKCQKKFTMLEKYQLQSGQYCTTYCSYDCKSADRSEIPSEDSMGRSPLVIYRICNKETAKNYIGQTTQPFTLRWWQHFSYPGDTEFHKAIKDSELKDWFFEIVEVVESPDQLNDKEAYWVNHYDAIKNGYNTASIAHQGGEG